MGKSAEEEVGEAEERNVYVQYCEMKKELRALKRANSEKIRVLRNKENRLMWKMLDFYYAHEREINGLKNEYLWSALPKILKEDGMRILYLFAFLYFGLMFFLGLISPILFSGLLFVTVVSAITVLYIFPIYL